MNQPYVPTRFTIVFRAVMFVVVLAVTTVAPMLAPSVTRAVTDCSPNGIAYGSASWLGGVGVNVCNHPGDATNNYINNVNGVSTFSGTKWQCVEMVNRLYLARGWTTATWSGNGNTLVNNVPNGLTKQDNGAITYISPGDVITLDKLNTAGHAAIVDSVTTSGSTTTVNIVNQNTQSIDSSAYIESGSFGSGNARLHMNNWTDYTVQSIIHHPGGGAPAGTDTIGSFDPNAATYYLRNNNTPGSADAIVQFGAGGWLPVVGDWDGNGSDTIGSFNPSTATFYMRNSNTPGSADTIVQFGAGGWQPLVGNWDGMGADGIGSYDPSTATFYLKNVNVPGSADAIIQFGAGGWLPVVGDWDGNGTTTIGSFNPSTATFYLRNSNTPGNADAVIQFGAGGWKPMVGDWDGNGSTTIGSFDPGAATFYLRNSNSPGSADAIAQFGAGGWTPVVGDWNGQ